MKNSWKHVAIILFWVLISTAAMPLESQEAIVAREVSLLKEGDVVSVNVFNESSLTGAFPVGPDGAIVFPLLGNIPAEGMSADMVASEIERRLEADYIRDAQVSVALAEKAELPPQTVTVIGQVASPGPIPFEAGGAIDLFTAVAAAGGVTEQGNRSRIELKRREGSDLNTRIVSLESSRVLPLQDGDTIIVHTRPKVVTVVEEKEVFTVTLIGQVKNPGQIPINPEQPLDIISAIAIAGGFTELARPSKVIVRRNTVEGIQVHEINVSRMQRGQVAPFILAPNDQITVEESIF